MIKKSLFGEQRLLDGETVEHGNEKERTPYNDGTIDETNRGRYGITTNIDGLGCHKTRR